MQPLTACLFLRNAALALVCAAGLAGCASDGPYTFTDYRWHQRGQVVVCYDESSTTDEQARAVAEDICQQYDRTTQWVQKQNYQCSWTAPMQAIFQCVARPGENPAPVIQHNAPMRHDTPLPPQ
jgi:hypothetical protein